jgi:hypothetical protein
VRAKSEGKMIHPSPKEKISAMGRGGKFVFDNSKCIRSSEGNRGWG